MTKNRERGAKGQQPGADWISNKDALLSTLTKTIVDSVHPLRIILFGSAARGSMGRNSDIDVLVVMPEGTHRRRTAQRIYRALSGTGFSKDILVVTQKDIRDFGDEPSLVIKPALEEGKELYRAA